MKTIKFKTILTLFLFTLIIVSCDDDDEPAPIVYELENIQTAYLTQSGFNQETNSYTNDGDYEFGLEFTPTVTGKITAINVKIPDTNTALRVTIWNATTQTVLRTEIVNVVNADTNYSFDIADLDLIKDTKYAISMNSDDWYERTKTDGSDVTYPMSIGNINVEAYGYASGTTQTYMESFSVYYYAGDLFFTFQQTEE